MNRGLGRAVGRCHGQREERQPGRDSHDRGPWLASQQREQSTRQADRAQQIGGYHRFGVDKVLGRSLQVFWTHNAGVVDNDVERGKFACHLRRHGTDALGVLDVEQDGLHPRIRGGRFLERFAPTAGDHYLIVCLKKRFRQSASYTRAAASNEDGVAIDVHVFSSFALKVTKCKSLLKSGGLSCTSPAAKIGRKGATWGQPSGQPLTYDILWVRREDVAGAKN